MSTTSLLAGVRVLDFGRYIAGPYCAALLAGLGAEVIRIERIDGGEDRYLLPLADGADGGALFLQVNQGKRGMTLDLRAAGAREVVRRLAANADVVVANLPGPSLEALGLDYPSLSAIRADIVLTTVSAYGSGPGPWSGRPGFDGVGQVMSGAAYMSGGPELPVKSYVPWVDFLTASLAALGTLAALVDRSRTGTGRHVEGSLLASALTVGNSTLIEEAVTEVGRVATHNRAQVAAPADVFATRDGWIIVQVVGAGLFRRWARLVERADLIDEGRFATDAQRGKHRDELCEIMAAWCSSRTSEEALAALAGAGVPGAPVLSPAETLIHPQVAALGLLAPTSYPGIDAAIPTAGFPVRLGFEDVGAARRAPRLGEHTDEILREVGFDAAEIATLRRDGVV